MKRILFAALAATALAASGLPGSAEASTTAGANVINVVEVEYSDASGNNTFYAAASTTVSVNLVKAALNASSFPKDGAVAGLTCLGGNIDTVSGGTISALYALTATANGDDNYSLSLSDNTPTTTSDASNITRTFSTLAYDGTVVTTGDTARVFGSAIPVGVSGTDTLLFPGGSLGGFEPNDIVLVEIGPGKVQKAFKVLNVVLGSAATHPNADGATGYTDGRISDLTAEVQGSLQLAPYDNYSITLNGVGTPFRVML